MVRERDFTGSASHELRTPITVITGAIELLEQGDLSAEDVKAVDRIRRATLEMKSTIEMFLCIAREADDGQYGERFRVAPLVDRAIEQQRYLLGGKGVDVDVHVEGHATPVVQGHPQVFLIAVANLVRTRSSTRPPARGRSPCASANAICWSQTGSVAMMPDGPLRMAPRRPTAMAWASASCSGCASATGGSSRCRWTRRG